MEFFFGLEIGRVCFFSRAEVTQVYLLLVDGDQRAPFA